MRTLMYPRTTPFPLLSQILLALLGSIALFFLAAITALLGFQLIYLGRVFPGVSVAGIDLSGLTQVQAAARISQELVFPRSGRLLLRDQEHTWAVTPAELGLFLDPETSALNAFQVGRRGNLAQNLSDQFNSLQNGQSLPPTLIFDQRMAFQVLSNIAQQTDIPVVEPSLTLNGTEVMVQTGQAGHQLDIPGSLALLSLQLQSMRDGVVPLIITENKPVIADVSAQAELARTILSQPLTLAVPSGQPDRLGPWIFQPSDLARLLTFQRVQDNNGGRYELTVNDHLLREILTNLAPSLELTPKDARFIFNDETRQLEVIEHSVTGRSLDIETSIKTIREKMLKGEHNLELNLTLTPPPVTDQMTAEQLGISELIHTETSYFYGSSPERVQNIKASASRFHGLLIAPGETFSMAQALGDISLDNGYAEALIIVGGRTVQGVGGGVCQVSTTLFRAAFFSGFPIIERHAHAYRVSYYEKVAGNRRDASLAGMDATVFAPLVDLKFTNDTQHWLLMEVYVNPTYSTIVWKFYSTSDGRTVDWDTTGPVHVVEAPKPLYRENPDLPSGEVKQVDWAADGADVTVTRTVHRDGNIYLQDTFETHYEPWQAIFEYGPGTEGMPPPEN